jgi:hypothetical protein
MRAEVSIMKKLIPTLFFLLLAGVLGGCAGRGYGEVSYGGVYSSYHPFAPAYFFYDYPYSGYHAGYHHRFRSRPFIIHPRSSLDHDRRMIIDRRHTHRHFLDDRHRRDTTGPACAEALRTGDSTVTGEMAAGMT